MTIADSPTDRLAINTLRFLAVDMVEQAKSGHPGAPMGQAPAAYVLWKHHLRVAPARPRWLNRDRFILSCGHASALLYGLLHLAGFALPIEQLRRFRQLGSMTPGHPEFGHTPGVDTTTGPLGQGLGNAVGMAMAERLLSDRFNRPGFELFDFRTWVLASDGDLMEGVASEAASLAGHLRLNKLNVLYDKNGITIDGKDELAWSENVAARFAAYGWFTTEIEDVNDLVAVDRAIREATAADRPSLVLMHTHIGYGSPHKQDSAAAHGSPLGAEESKLAKKNLGWPLEPALFVPEETRAAFAQLAERGEEAVRVWDDLRARWAEQYPELAGELERREKRGLPIELEAAWPRFGADHKPIATRAASGHVLNAIAGHLPELVGGSADLTGSNNTWLDGEAVFSPYAPGRNIHFGVREHGMAAALNGLTLTGLLRPYGGTFLVFADYLRPSLRLAALMGLPVIFVLTHDSIFLGEDGPTHQPEAHLASLRAIPNVVVVRPADANETAAAWRIALSRTTGPTALVLTRQSLPVLPDVADRHDDVARGGYVLRAAPALAGAGSESGVLIATGSEVDLALRAQAALAQAGDAVRVVSLPSWELFTAQPVSYRDEVLPPELRRRLAIEAANPFGWERWVGDAGGVLGLLGFGGSAPAEDLAEEFGFTVENVVARYRAL